MQTLDHSRIDVALRWIDGIVLLLVLHTAAATILGGTFEADPSALRWYLMACLYTGASWLASPHVASRTIRRLAGLNLLLGAHACLRSAYAAGTAVSAPSTLVWWAWLVLSLCFVLSAVARWPWARLPHDSSSS
ncbi:hypothetical protein [Pseudorhodoferax soli]|uniref:hypothetical protein n=1 Tax=Pseudorhodoferax soli TaxID=545864 RepID=UPI000DF3AC27|nr:hypothetical protein [Pseudorhodoferax soli]